MDTPSSIATKPTSPKSSDEPAPPIVSLKGISKRFYFDTHRSGSLREWFIRSVLRRPVPDPPVAFSIAEMNLDVRRGDALALVGRNGSGKSTLLRILAGIYRPTTGEVVRRGSIAAVLELGAGFHEELPGSDNVMSYAAALGLSRRETLERYDEIVRFADIGDVLAKPIKHYSTGMQARLALAVALCVEPDLLILDEALSVGDRIFRRKTYERLKRYLERGGTLIMVSHDIPTLREFCTRAVWLNDGRVEADGEAHSVIRAYRQAK